MINILLSVLLIKGIISQDEADELAKDLNNTLYPADFKQAVHVVRSIFEHISTTQVSDFDKMKAYMEPNCKASEPSEKAGQSVTQEATAKVESPVEAPKAPELKKPIATKKQS